MIKKIIAAILLLLVLIFALFAKRIYVSNSYKNVLFVQNKKPVNQKKYRRAVMDIKGMYCTSCALGAEYALKEKRGVVSARVDYDTKRGVVVYNPSQISKLEIINAIKPYTAVIIKDTVK